VRTDLEMLAGPTFVRIDLKMLAGPTLCSWLATSFTHRACSGLMEHDCLGSMLFDETSPDGCRVLL